MLKVVLAIGFSVMQIVEIYSHDPDDHCILYSSALLWGVGLCSAAFCWFYRWSSALQTGIWSILVTLPLAMELIYVKSSSLGIQFCISIE